MFRKSGMARLFSTLPESQSRNDSSPKTRKVSHEVIPISSDEDSDISDENKRKESDARRTRILQKTKNLRFAGLGSMLEDQAHERLEDRYLPQETFHQTKRRKVKSEDEQNDVKPQTDTENPEKTLWEAYQHGLQLLPEPSFLTEDTTFDQPLRQTKDQNLHLRPLHFNSSTEEHTSPSHLPGRRNTDIRSVGTHMVKRGRSKRPKTAPYFDDPKFQVRFYCGPGYEKFPIVLGSKREHQKICDNWDRKEAAKIIRAGKSQAFATALERFTTDQSAILSDNDSDEVDESSENSPAESACLAQVVAVLPDIEHEFVLQIIRAKIRDISSEDNNDDLIIWPSANEIILEVLEQNTYPKQQANEQEATDGTGKTITFERQSDNLVRYLLDTVIILASHFEYVPTHHIYQIVHQKQNLADAFNHLHALEMEYSSGKERPYRRLRQPRSVLEKKYCNPSGIESLSKVWENAVNELQAARQNVEREKLRLRHERELIDEEAANLQHHIDRNDCFECQCCFDDQVPNNRAVICNGTDEIHSFCYVCVKSLAENQLGMMKYELLCMDSSDCKAHLTSEGVAQAVPRYVIDKLAYYQQQAEIAAANIDGLEQCHFCDFKAICDPVEIQPNFSCQNIECGRTACRKCHEDAHGSKSCEDAKVDKGLSVRHVIEEARSEAAMRQCPKCNVKIIKLSGCNKIMCTRCQCMICFVCKKDISDKREGGYQHFHGPGAKCSLHDGVDFDRHDYDADEAEKEAIKKARAENADLNEKELQIETGKNKKIVTKPVRRDYMEIARQQQQAFLAEQARIQARHRMPLQMQMQMQMPIPLPLPPPPSPKGDEIRNYHRPLAQGMHAILPARMPKQTAEVEGRDQKETAQATERTRAQHQTNSNQPKMGNVHHGNRIARDPMENVRTEDDMLPNGGLYQNNANVPHPIGQIPPRPYFGEFGGLYPENAYDLHMGMMPNRGIYPGQHPLNVPPVNFPALLEHHGLDPVHNYAMGQALGHHAYGAVNHPTINQTFVNQTIVNQQGLAPIQFQDWEDDAGSDWGDDEILKFLARH